MLEASDKQILQYDKAIWELQEKLNGVDEFENVALKLVGSQSVEVEALRKENAALSEEIKRTKSKLQIETTITNDIQGVLDVFQEKIVMIMDIINKEPLDKEAVLRNLGELLAQE